VNANCIHKKLNAENAHLKARPKGRCSETRLYVIASYHASFNLETVMLLPPRMEGIRIFQEQKSVKAMP